MKAICIDGVDTGKRSSNPANAVRSIQSLLAKRGLTLDYSDVSKAMKVTKNAFSYDTPADPGKQIKCNAADLPTAIAQAALSLPG